MKIIDFLKVTIIILCIVGLFLYWVKPFKNEASKSTNFSKILSVESLFNQPTSK